MMSNNRIKRLVVIDDEQHVKGVISRPDLVTLFLRRD